ncbi:hypothetical protein GXP70_20705 [Paenibacillus lycopersici]|uniref:Uncharacterized protein n=1 Tax=Paenibacillus lycopersici TaxID=2704462 RepID=A0A6C0G355_9BACL|nr:hypothetical protein [Paenibacillus lycopersici]QHT62161.1 hypothetical protein GXP70_20705 [Paenibacillus lycopersici]
MARRYRITRSLQAPEEGAKPITLEECKAYFQDKPDFTYTNVFTVKGETTMSIEGDFFMWRFGESLIPFRHYDGDLYVSGTNEAVIPVMLEAAGALKADVTEG